MGSETVTLSSFQNTLIAVYVVLWAVFALLGARRLWMIWLYRRARRRPAPAGGPLDHPVVTVQLPVFNERYVIRRLIRSVAELDWPRDRLEIQVLDDSTDETTAVATEEVERLRAEGLDIVLLRRPDRVGYKAGALAYGMERAKGDFLLIFDADFVPRPGLIRAVLPQFADPRVGMVQVRWDHLNADSSLLARVQAIALDGHFVVEHEARSKHGLFFNFNGTAGIWRKRCIQEAGGWQHDTLTEDLDLSYRAQFAGWKFVYLRDVTCPSELPVDMRAFKSQQFRWMKGSAQVARKMIPRVWKSDLPWTHKLELLVHLTQNMSFVLVFLLSLCVYPAVLMQYASGWLASAFVQVPLIFLATGSVVIFYGAAVAGAGRNWKFQLRYFPALMSVAIGLSVSNTQAILEGVLGVKSPFHRTPKRGEDAGPDAEGPDGKPDRSYRGLPSWTTFLELAFAAYFVGVFVLIVSKGLVWAIPFVALFLFGYLYVGVLSAEFTPPGRPRSG